VIRKLLIANRGEIARRIRRTATAMGIKAIAVYTSDERTAPFVAECDEAVLLEGEGPAPYLDIAGLVGAARRSGADAVHPGYGFLAENADFARAITNAGLGWVGPPAEAIARMGDKLESKRIAIQARVPTLEAEEGDVSLPALVKAAFGGGGKGMRVVRTREELDDAVAAARREAERAFGDGTIFIEPFLEKVRHIEIQVLGDSHGNLIHLGERECSIQRRHQKVVEEAPSVAVDAAMRERMGEAAVSLAKAIGYRNAGTVEFLLGSDGDFYFMEMNTRLQVEHPVTEEAYGVDLVREQLLEAGGEEITATQTDPSGHAIEVRLNAEDPANDFLPETGTLVGWAEARAGVRYDVGVADGSIVTTAFDPLIGKVIAHAPTRAEAAAKLALALEQTTIQGVTTNRDVLVEILRDGEFLSGNTTTDYLERVSVPVRRELTEQEISLALACVVVEAEEAARASARVLATLPSGWRNSRMPAQRRMFEIAGEERTVEYTVDGVVTFGDGTQGRRLPTGQNNVEATYGAGVGVVGNVRRDGDKYWVHGPWGDVVVLEKSLFPSSEIEEEAGSLHAPMPGSVVSVEIAVGDAVRKGQTLVVLEAMKMEHPIGCPEDGVVSEIKVSAGDQVERGALLVVVESSE
jgi:propionyl-CoA carboxylase alpha chain